MDGGDVVRFVQEMLQCDLELELDAIPDLRAAIGLGVKEIIRKPFSGTLLLHRVGRLLEDH